jgi:hypothetical protein
MPQAGTECPVRTPGTSLISHPATPLTSITSSIFCRELSVTLHLARRVWRYSILQVRCRCGAASGPCVQDSQEGLSIPKFLAYVALSPRGRAEDEH